MVGDQKDTAQALASGFSEGELDVRSAKLGREALTIAAENLPSVIITDTILPDMPATDLIRSFREWSSSPIIAVSEDGRIQTKVDFLNAGADDYMVKPVGRDEFHARIRVAFRHQEGQQADFGPIFKIGDTTVNFATKTVNRNGEPVPLTPLEFQILAELVRGGGRIVTRETITQKIWSSTTIAELQTMRVYIGTLRDKLGRGSDADLVIETVAGVGYRLFTIEPRRRRMDA